MSYTFSNSHSHTEYLFNKFDRNRDGFLDREELRAFYDYAGHHIDHRALDIQLKYLNASHRGVDIQNFRSIVTVRDQGRAVSNHHEVVVNHSVPVHHTSTRHSVPISHGVVTHHAAPTRHGVSSHQRY